MQFEDEEEAKIWILTNQIARRNLESFRKYEFTQERNKLIKSRMKAKELGVGTGTVARMQYIKKKADEDAVADEVLKQLGGPGRYP